MIGEFNMRKKIALAFQMKSHLPGRFETKITQLSCSQDNIRVLPRWKTVSSRGSFPSNHIWWMCMLLLEKKSRSAVVFHQVAISSWHRGMAYLQMFTWSISFWFPPIVCVTAFSMQCSWHSSSATYITVLPCMRLLDIHTILLYLCM